MVQVIARENREDLVIAVMYALEQEWRKLASFPDLLAQQSSNK
jgi:hypothetical protein